MRTMSSRIVPLVSAFALPLLAGCVSMGTPSPQVTTYGPEAFERIRDSVYGTPARDASAREAPRVTIITPATMDASRYVDASVRVSDDAYVAVLAVDNDGRVRMLYPESPSEAGLVSAAKAQPLRRFFSGFGTLGLSRLGTASYSAQALSQRANRGGVIIAVASREPLQLARIADGNGDWDEDALEQLVLEKSVSSAAYALGNTLSLTGQQFDTDYSGFVESSRLASFAYAPYGTNPCSSDQSGTLVDYAPRASFSTGSDGTRYITMTSGDPCFGFTQRTVALSSSVTGSRVGVDSLSPARGSIAARRAASSATALRFRPPQRLHPEPGVNGLAESVHPRADRPTEWRRRSAEDRPRVETTQRPSPRESQAKPSRGRD